MSLFKAEKKIGVILAVLVNLSIPYNFLDPKDNTLLFSKRKTQPHPSPTQSLSCPFHPSLTALAEVAGRPAIHGMVSRRADVGPRSHLWETPNVPD